MRPLLHSLRCSAIGVALLLMPAPDAAAQLVPDWVERFGLTDSWKDTFSDVITDASGNIYVTGTTIRVNPTGSDALTIKYAPDGTLLWFTVYDGPLGSSDASASLIEDPAGDILVLGRSQGDFLVLKYKAADGSLIWASHHSGPGVIEEPNAFTTDASGNIYVTGYTRLSSVNNMKDFYTYKLDSQGNVVERRAMLDLARHSDWDVEVEPATQFGSTRSQGQSQALKRSSPQDPRLTTEIVVTMSSMATWRWRSLAS